MKRTHAATPLVIALAALSLSPVALAQSAGEPAAGSESASLDERAGTRGKNEGEANQVECVRETGTRLSTHARRDDAKTCQPGRAYNRDDIDRTGASSLADALQRLDPAVTIRRR